MRCTYVQSERLIEFSNWRLVILVNFAVYPRIHWNTKSANKTAMSIYVTCTVNTGRRALLEIEKSSMIQARDVTNHLALFHRREARGKRNPLNSQDISRTIADLGPGHSRFRLAPYSLTFIRPSDCHYDQLNQHIRALNPRSSPRKES